MEIVGVNEEDVITTSGPSTNQQSWEEAGCLFGECGSGESCSGWD